MCCVCAWSRTIRTRLTWSSTTVTDGRRGSERDSWATRPSTSEASAASSSSPVAARTHSLRSLCSRNAVMSSTTIIRQALPSVAPIRRRAGDDISHYQREPAADAAAPASDRAESVDHGSLRLRTVRGPPEQVLRAQAVNGPGPRRARQGPLQLPRLGSNQRPVDLQSNALPTELRGKAAQSPAHEETLYQKIPELADSTDMLVVNMHLKSLTLRGFKSFASATKLELEPGITCVVGPNGSGKSNVVDALSWVMGEQGAKNLRGGKMEDVIFAGTVRKQALGRAEVALTIDNTDGALPIDYTEVTISRTLFRSGGSEYRVNGEPARLLDIQELLSDSGLGKEMHVIVGQGRLDAILHADPFERRGFIEEAAGVLKHRKRKEKALRKLTGLQTNLDRLADLRSELARQLGPLGRQARAAQRAQVVQAVLRDATARLLADDLVQLQARIAATTPDHDPAERRRGLEEDVRVLDEQIGEAEDARRTFDAGTEAVHERRTTIAAQHTRAKALAQRAGDRVRMLTSAAEQQRPAGESPDALRERAERFAAEHEEAEQQAAERRTA